MLLVLQVGGWWKVRLSKVAAACVPDTLDGIVHSWNCRQESNFHDERDPLIHLLLWYTVCLLTALLGVPCIWMHQLPAWEFRGLALLCSFHRCVISNTHKRPFSKMKKKSIHCSPACGDTEGTMLAQFKDCLALGLALTWLLWTFSTTAISKINIYTAKHYQK